MLSLSARLYPIILRLPPAEGKAPTKTISATAAKLLYVWVSGSNEKKKKKCRCEAAEMRESGGETRK